MDRVKASVRSGRRFLTFVHFRLTSAMLRALGSTRRRSTRLQPTVLLPPCTCRFPFVASPLAATARNYVPSTSRARLHNSVPRNTRPQLATATDQATAIAGEAPPLLVQPNKMQMRPYQLDIINAVLDALREGPYTRLGVSAPTGKSRRSTRAEEEQTAGGPKVLWDA